MLYKVIFISVLCTFCLIKQISGSREFRLDVLVQDAEDAQGVEKAYETKRSMLSKEERALLEELFVADEVFMERQQKGIVDQILVAISGVTGGGGFGLVGARPVPAPLAGTAPPTTLPASDSKSDINSTATATVTTAPAATQTQNNDNHLFTQISKVILNSGTRNVSGIVDAALQIGTPAPIRDLVNGIIGAAYCNGIRRLLGRC